MATGDNHSAAGPSRQLEHAHTAPSLSTRRRTSRRAVRLSAQVAIAASLLLAASVDAQSARWGAASVQSSSTFIVHGGKTNGDSPGGGGYTFSSGPNTAEMWTLDMSRSFAASSAPWRLRNATSATAPAVAFHSLTALGGNELMLFGGSADASQPTQSGNDSSYLVTFDPSNSPSYASVPASWSQPERRVYHAASGDDNGHVWIVGGQSTSGSGAEYNEMWTTNAKAANPSFRQLDEPLGGVVQPTLACLDDGTILSLGGVAANGTLQSLDTLAFYSTSAKRWSTVQTRGATPPPRRGHVAVALPNKRVFVHGGASSDLTIAMGDAWLLDWSSSPPTWSQIAASSDAPSARFGHSATAYGAKVAIVFGWAANNPADASLYVFDATAMTQSSDRVWSGGQWTTSYTPDPNSNAGSNSGQSNGGSSSNTGGSKSGGKGAHTSTNDPFAAPTGTNTGSPNDSSSDSGAGAGTKAGAALGGLFALGVLVGVGYYAYRRHSQSQLNNWRRGDGEAGLLGYGGGSYGGGAEMTGAALFAAGGKHYSGPDELYTLEKGLAEREQDGGYRPGMHPVGPREPSRPNVTMSPWSLGNIGHAMEGSGPHLRERLAILTGFGMGNSSTQQQRFDMLAGEVDDHDEGADVFAMQRRNSVHYDKHDDDGDEDDEEDTGDTALEQRGKHTRELSYGRVEQHDWEDEYPSYGDIGAAAQNDNSFTRSPFEDESQSRAADRKQSAGPGGAAALYGEYGNDGDSQTGTEDATSITDGVTGSSQQSHANVSASTRSSQGGVASGGAMVSFSDSQGGLVDIGPPRRRSSSVNNGAGGRSPSAMMKRSPTWWDRFMGQSFLERSASGRLYTPPRAEERIRDPAEPPQLDSIRETGHSANPSAADSYKDPFADGRSGGRNVVLVGGAMDELGRRADAHNRSRSSLQSARTADTTLLEARMRTMDVQRAGTISSRRTNSSSRTGSLGSSGGELSRHTSLREHGTPADSTPGSIVWDPSQFMHGGGVGPTPMGGAVYEQDESDVGADPGEKRARDVYDDGGGYALSGVHVVAKTREPSSAPSLTPSTTKRARQNPDLVTPLSPSPPKRSQSPPTRGTVRDRARAIERKWTQEGPNAVLPLPRSPAMSMASAGEYEAAGSSPTLPTHDVNTFVPGRGGKPILTKLQPPSSKTVLSDDERAAFVSSPMDMRPSSGSGSNTTHTSGAAAPSANPKRFTHDLVPKAQLYVANPDDRRGSSMSGGSSTH